MLWIKPRTMDRKQGEQDTIVLLADRSGSMSHEAIVKIEAALPAFRRAIPGLRCYTFHADILEIDYTREDPIRGSYPDQGGTPDWNDLLVMQNTTYLGHCLEQIAKLRPSKTIVMSDGGVEDRRRALRAADRMPGDIDAYFCNAIRHEYEDMAFMQELARRGRGRFVHAGPDVCIELRKSLKLFIQPIIAVEHRPPEWNIHGSPVRGRVVAQSAADVAAKFRGK